MKRLSQIGLKKRIFGSKITLIGLFILIVLIGAVSLRAAWQKYQVKKEIDRLEDEIARLEGTRQDLDKLIGYLETPEYWEKEAREKLSLKRPGEKVAVITPGPAEQNGPEAQEKEEAIKPLSPVLANVLEWWGYLFK